MAESKEPTALEDVSAVKGYILGALAFAAAVSGFCTAVFGWNVGKVTAVAAVAAVVFIALAILIQRAETRNMKRLENHIIEANTSWNKIDNSLDYLKKMALENQRASIRIEMNSYISNEPQNHDTILSYAERYFIELDGDWKETDKFLQWVENENNAGRKVHVPPSLLANVRGKAENE